MKKRDSMYEAAKATPAISTSGALVAGLPLSDWVLIATLAYTVLQIAFLIRKWIRSKDE
jgi:hypothetical protein